MEYVYIDNDLEPEFEWDYLDQLQQDLADDYNFKDSSRKKRHTDTNIFNTTIQYTENNIKDLKHQLTPDSIQNALEYDNSEKSAVKATYDIDSKIGNLLENVYTKRKINTDTKSLSYESNTDRQDSYDVNFNLLKHSSIKHQDDRYARDPQKAATDKINTITTSKFNSKTTKPKDYTKYTPYDLSEHNVEITLINFENNLSTEYMTEFEPIHFDIKENVPNIPDLKKENDLKTIKETLSSDLDAMKTYLNSKTIHNKLLYSEGNKDFNNAMYNTNFQGPNILQEYVKKYSSKTSEVTGVQKFNNDSTSKMHKRQSMTDKPFSERVASEETSTNNFKENNPKTAMYKDDELSFNSITDLSFKTNPDHSSTVGSAVFMTRPMLDGNITHEFDDAFSKPEKHTTNPKATTEHCTETSTEQIEDILLIEPTLFDDKIYYDSSLKDIIPKIFKTKESKSDLKVGKRDVGTETFTARDVAALEVIVDLMKTNPNVVAQTPTFNLGKLAKSLKTDTKRVTNAIQVHIAVPYDVSDRKRSLEPLRVRKVFSAKMSSPVDLEYQVNSFEEPTPTTIFSRTIQFENEQIPPGMYLLVDNGVLKGNFALKPVKNFYLPNLQQRYINNVTDKIATTSVSKYTGKVTLSKDMVSAFNQQLLELFKQMADNETETQIIHPSLSSNDDRNKRSDVGSKMNQNTNNSSTRTTIIESTKVRNKTQLSSPTNYTTKIGRNKRYSFEHNDGNKNIISPHDGYNVDKSKVTTHNPSDDSVSLLGPINWDKIKQYFGHDRVCSCKCRVNKTLCKACAASDAVIGELIFEFDNLAKFMKDHCTEIQTYFWMNPTGGQKLRDSVHKLDKSLHDYYKRVKGKCQGKTCKTFTTYIDKRDNKQVPIDFLNHLENLATDVEKATKYIRCYDKSLIDKGDNLVHSINDCVLRRSGRDDEDLTTIKNVYALDNINVNIICKADTTKAFEMISASHFETIPVTESDPILDFDYDEKYNSKTKFKRKKLFAHPKKSKINKLFTYYVDKTTESFDIKKREVNNQIEVPLNSDAGGNFWNDYINRNKESGIIEEDKQDISKVGVTIVKTTNKGNCSTVTTIIKDANNTSVTTEAAIDAAPNRNIIELIRLFSDTKTADQFTSINIKKNITTRKPKTKKTKPKKTHIHKTTKNNTQKTNSSTTTTLKIPTKPTVNVTSKHLKSLVTELSNITEIIDASTPTTKTSKKSNNPFQKIKSATLDFLQNIEKGNFILDEKTLKTTPGRLKNDIEKDTNEYIFTDTMISNITTVANPTIVIIQDYDDLNDEIKNIDADFNHNLQHNDNNQLAAIHKDFKRLNTETNIEISTANDFNSHFDHSLDTTISVNNEVLFDDLDDKIVNNNTYSITKIDDEIKNEKYRNLLLSIIDFQRERLNDEWQKYLYSTNGRQSFEDYGFIDLKSDINLNQKASSHTSTVFGDYDILRGLKSLELPDPEPSPASNGSRLLDFVHKFGMKIVPRPKDQKVVEEVSTKSDDVKKVKAKKLWNKKKLKISPKSTDSSTSRSTTRIVNMSLLNDTKPEKEIKAASSEKDDKDSQIIEHGQWKEKNKPPLPPIDFN
ncbi:hypothetical protein K1T71_014292 [Dendrolimus kikuchii]|uniref:Uncharacterized protein n=1 Tax=Dendrolimus kikuchii TaxID=765133 RepID=A0ACC1CFV7_9NEOP|nr:hypothetical protein K1T71_014292 [Dendrolimus kikuchii]